MNLVMTDSPKSKICTKCGVDKILDEFNDHPACKYGKRPDCKKCQSDCAKERYKATSNRVSLQEIRSFDYLIKKIKSNYIYESNSGCFLWNLVLDKDGYGRLSWNERTERAHRFSYEAFVGEIPEGLQVCHRCDTPSCVRPDHLFIGTQLENHADRDKKGRQSKGEERWTSKVKELDVIEVLTLFHVCGLRRWEISELFGLSRSLIQRIISGKTWKHLSGIRSEIISYASIDSLQET
jgi:HNH endonuclease